MDRIQITNYEPPEIINVDLSWQPELPTRGKLISFYIAGYKYYDGELFEKNLYIGNIVSLKREPGNPYDANAIEIYANDIKLGYVPATQNKKIIKYFREYNQVAARIEKIKTDKPEFLRIKIAIFKIDLDI